MVKHRVLLADLEFRIALEPYGQRVVTVCRQIRFVDVDGRNRFVRAGFQVGSREGVGAFGQRDVLRAVLGVIGREHCIAVFVFHLGIPLVVELGVGCEFERIGVGGAQVAFHDTGVLGQHLGLLHPGIDQDGVQLLVDLGSRGREPQRKDVVVHVGQRHDPLAVEADGEGGAAAFGRDRTGVLDDLVVLLAEQRVGGAVRGVESLDGIGIGYDLHLRRLSEVAAAVSVNVEVDRLLHVVIDCVLHAVVDDVDARVGQVVVAVVFFAGGQQQHACEGYQYVFQFHNYPD